MNKSAKTKIVATLGPGTSSEDSVISLVNAGATMFRLNTSHETKEAHADRISLIRKIAKSLNKHIPILVDLQGPKIRVGNLKEPIELVEGAEVILKPGMEPEDDSYIPVDYSGIVKDVKKGDKVLLDDGKLALQVLSTTTKEVRAKVLHGGLLKARKGLNIPGTTSSISAVTERDIEFIKFAVEQDADYIALSFVRAKEDVIKAKHYANQFGGDIPVIAKIEKPQALDNLDSIITASDGIMVARGDLGIEISPERVPIVQKDIIKKTNAQRKVVIVATQMLESMIEQPMPTRAEASDVANAIIDGADAVMLSGETAVGKFPTEAVGMMTMIAENVESNGAIKQNTYSTEAKEIYDMDSQAICSAIIRMVEEMEINAIVAFTRTGYTAGLLSKAKPSVPIYAFSDEDKVCNRVNLFWDVFPVHLECERELNEKVLQEIDKVLIGNTSLSPGDKVIITGSIPYMVTGKTNFIRLHQVGSTATMY